MFEVVVAKEDTQRHKPDSEPLLFALAAMDADAAEAAYVREIRPSMWKPPTTPRCGPSPALWRPITETGVRGFGPGRIRQDSRRSSRYLRGMARRRGVWLVAGAFAGMRRSA